MSKLSKETREGPRLDAAIECLGWYLTDMKACAGKEGGCLDHTKDIEVVESAIAVLEAAGKVTSEDRQWTTSLLWGVFAATSVTDLLEALPDGGKVMP